MSRRSTLHNKSRLSISRDSEDPFAEDDLSIKLTDMENNYGKRTGKFYEPKKWRRTPSGFMEYQQDQSDDSLDSLTPNTKLQQLKKKFGFDSEQEPSQGSSSSGNFSEKQEATSPEPRILIKKPPNERYNNQIGDKKTNLSKRQSEDLTQSWDFSFSFHQNVESPSEEQEEYEQENKEKLYKAQQQGKRISEKKSVRKAKQADINYNDDLPKISMFRSKSKKKQPKSGQRSNEEKRKSLQRKWELDFERQQQRKKSQRKKKSEQRKKSEQKKRSEEKKKQEKIKRSEQRKRSEERKRSEKRKIQEEKKRFQQNRKQQQKRKKEEKKRQEKRLRSEQRRLSEQKRRKQQKAKEQQRKRKQQVQRKQAQQRLRQEQERKRKQEKKRLQEEIRRQKQQKRKEQEIIKQSQRKRQQKLRKEEQKRLELKKKRQQQEREYEERIKEAERQEQKRRKQLSKKKQQERMREIQRQRLEEEEKLKEEERKKKNDKKKKTSKRYGNYDSDDQEQNQQKQRKYQQIKNQINIQESINQNKKADKPLKNRLLPKRQKLEIQHDPNQKPLISSDQDDELSDAKFELSISQIKARKRQQRRSSIFGSLSPNESIRSLIQQMDGVTSPQSEDYLNNAIINTQSEKFQPQNTQLQTSDDKKYAFKKNKHLLAQNSNLRENLPEKAETKRNDYYRLRGRFSEDVLTDSLKKGAEEFHQKIEKQAEKRQQKQTQQAKANKRDRIAFQTVYTNDILDQDKMQNLKKAQQHIKGNKKSKPNEQQKDENIPKGNKAQNFLDRQLGQYEHQYLENQQEEEKKKIQQKTNEAKRRIIQEAEKGLKRKDKPKRINLNKKDSKKLQQQNQDNNPLPVKNKNKQNKKKNSDDEEYIQSSQVETSSNNLPSNVQGVEQSRYPHRNKISRTNFFGKPIYTNKRQLIAVSTKQIHVLVGWIQQSSRGTFKVIEALTKEEKYFERLKINGQSILQFYGFDDTFSQLDIHMFRNRSNSKAYGKYLTVSHGQVTEDLSQKVVVLPNTGSFTIANSGREVATIEMILTINEQDEELLQVQNQHEEQADD